MKYEFSADELFEIEKLVKKLTPKGKQQFFAGNKDGLEFESIIDDLLYLDTLRNEIDKKAYENKSLRRNCYT